MGTNEGATTTTTIGIVIILTLTLIIITIFFFSDRPRATMNAGREARSISNVEALPHPALTKFVMKYLAS